MIGRVLLAALLAGIAAGLVMGVIQQVRLTPLILAAETYESAATTAVGDDHGAPLAWAPSDGIERAVATTAATAITGAGFAAVLAGISLLVGIPITPRNGMVWGLCGFLAVTVAPAAGLPPELPGMPAGDLIGRQIWWSGTIIATGFGIYLIATRRGIWPLAAAASLIALPQVIGAPVAGLQDSNVPPGLAAAFAANAIAAAAVFWCLIGTFLGLALQKFPKGPGAT